MSDAIVTLLTGEYHWLIDFVKQQADLDFQTGSNKQESWVSVYRGTSRLFRVSDNLKRKITIDATDKYKHLEPQLYKTPTPQLFLSLIDKIKNEPTLSRYYDNKCEGYYQNAISRRYGICGKPDDEFIIVDKEVVIGYCCDAARKQILTEFSNQYKGIAKRIIASEAKFPSKLDQVSFGNECDFIMLTKEGELILTELKYGRDTQKIYLSPFQISMYCDIFNLYDQKSDGNFRRVLLEMIKQKQRLGLLNPQWTVPKEITKISSALVIGGKYFDVAAEKYRIVRNYVKKYDITTYVTNDNIGCLTKIAL